MILKYATVCRICDLGLPVGTEVLGTKGSTGWHFACPKHNLDLDVLALLGDLKSDAFGTDNRSGMSTRSPCYDPSDSPF